MQQGIIISAVILIVIIIVYVYFRGQKTAAAAESFRITTAPRPKTFDEVMTGVPLEDAYNNEIFEERNCSGAPGMEYLL